MRFRLILVAFSLVAAGSAAAQETGLQTRLDLGLTWAHLSDTDLNQTYGSLPLVGVTGSFVMAPATRLCLGLDYGHRSGNPFYDTAGFDGSSEASLKVLRTRLGMKYNLSSNPGLRVLAGFALMMDWVREDLPPQMAYGGGLDNSPADGLIPGFSLTFAPEWVLGRGGKGVGLELGFGGTMGELSGDTHYHDVDLTGYWGRAYFVLDL